MEIQSRKDNEANKDKMGEPYDPENPIDEYFKRIEDAMQYAEDGNSPFSPQKIVLTAYHAITLSGLYVEEIKERHKKESADQTWGNFKTHFSA